MLCRHLGYRRDVMTAVRAWIDRYPSVDEPGPWRRTLDLAVCVTLIIAWPAILLLLVWLEWRSSDTLGRRMRHRSIRAMWPGWPASSMNGKDHDVVVRLHASLPVDPVAGRPGRPMG